MTYDNTLPQVFPYVALVTQNEAISMSRLLATKEGRYDHGSSFAVTSDAYVYPDGRHMRRLWLSAASAIRIRKTFPHIRIQQSYDEGE